MADIDIETFSSKGLGLGADDVRILADVFRKACVLLAVPLSAGIILTGLSDLGKAGQGQAVPKSMALAMILAGAGIGLMAAGGVCSTMKLRIESYLAGYPDTRSAIAGLTPGKRAELQAEALRLVRLGAKVEELYRDQQEDRFSGVPSA